MAGALLTLCPPPGPPCLEGGHGWSSGGCPPGRRHGGLRPPQRELRNAHWSPWGSRVKVAEIRGETGGGGVCGQAASVLREQTLALLLPAGPGAAWTCPAGCPVHLGLPPGEGTLGICPARGLVTGPPSCTPAFPVRSARPRLAWVQGPHPRSVLCCRRPESPLTVGPDLRRSLGSPRGWRSFHEEETPCRSGPAACEGRTQGGLVATVLTWEPSLSPPLRGGWRGRTVGRKKPGEATQVVSHPHHPSHGDVITQGNRDSRVPAVHVLTGPGAGTAPRCRLLPTLSPHAAPREGSPRVVVGHLCAGASGRRSRNPLPHRIVGQRSGCRGEAACCFLRSRYPGRFL